MNLPQLVLSRVCGECTACCTVMEIPELAKPPNSPCPKLCGSGCGIYGEHPPSCKGFYCAWRLGMFTDDDRPDKLGVVFSYKMDSTLSPLLLVAEDVRPQATTEQRPYEIMLAESERQLIYIRSGESRRLIGPEAELRRIQPMVDEAMRKYHGSKSARDH